MTARLDAEPPRGHETLPHTADVILHAWAPTRGECLAELVVALGESFAGVAHARPIESQAFRVDAPSDDELVVALLEEALYLLDANGRVVTSAVVDVAGTTASGRLDLAAVDDVELIGSVPKGVARSGLRFIRSDGGWRCVVTVDV